MFSACKDACRESGFFERKTEKNFSSQQIRMEKTGESEVVKNRHMQDMRKADSAKEREATKTDAEKNVKDDRSRERRGGAPKDILRGKLNGKEKTQLLFVGSLNCLRHRPYMVIGELMKEEKTAILSPSLADFSSGRYIKQIEEAIIELSEERNSKDFVLVCGCQWTILSTDGDLIIDNLKKKGIELVISVDDHLEFGDHE